VNLQQALAYVPQFALVSVAKDSRHMFSFATYGPMEITVRGDQHFPNVRPASESETLLDQWGVEAWALGLIGSDGGRLPVELTGAETVATHELFHYTGAVAITDRRIIGSGALGASLLGEFNTRGGNQLLIAVPYAEIFSVTLMRAEGRRGKLVDAAIRLHLPNCQSAMRLDVKGRLLTARSKLPVAEAAQQLVAAVCDWRTQAQQLDQAEQQRVAAVRAGTWSSEGKDLVAYVRHPDDIPEWVTAGIDDDLFDGT
jgi:hypothetical protein